MNSSKDVSIYSLRALLPTNNTPDKCTEQASNSSSNNTSNSSSNNAASASNASNVFDSIVRLIDASLSEPYSIYTFRVFVYQFPNLCFFACSDSSTSTKNSEASVSLHASNISGLNAVPENHSLMGENHSALADNVIGCIIARLVDVPHSKKQSNLNAIPCFSIPELSFSGEQSQPTQRGYIAMLVVKEEWRRHGIAARLLQSLLEEFKRLGIREVLLETEASNQAALGFYEKQGFYRDKYLPRYYFNGSAAYRLKFEPANGC